MTQGHSSASEEVTTSCPSPEEPKEPTQCTMNPLAEF